MPKIHPTAMVDAGAELADDVEIGPYAVVEEDASIGAGTVLRHHAVLRRFTSLGRNNFVDSFAVLGGEPQDFKFDPKTKSHLIIGDNNVFREGVTISRATGEGNATTIGSNTYWMTTAHAGHNAVVEDGAILVNNVAIAGHTHIGKGAILSAHVVVHQFCWVGDMVIIQGNGGATVHLPPYLMVAGINHVIGLNTVGLRRAKHLSDDDRRQIKDAFKLTFRSRLTPRQVLEKMDACADWGAGAGLFRDFIRKVVTAAPPYNRPIPRLRAKLGDD